MPTTTGVSDLTAAAPGVAGRTGAVIARGAVVVAGFTVLSRLFGLVRTVVFARTVGASCLGTAYVTAFQVPNLVYELVLGGALTSVMVPVLARSAERADADPVQRAHVSQITAALLTWSIAILVPLTLVIAGAAMPIAALLDPVNPNAACVRSDMISATGHMLQAFAPQILLYGLSVVFYGLLQAYRRFSGPTLGPALSSVMVIASCLTFAMLGRGRPLARLPLPAELILAAGTTAGIAVMTAAGVVPAWRLHLRLRPTWRFPPGVARRAGGLALVGIVEIVFSELATVVAITLANGRGSTGALVLFNYASEMFNSVLAVLALSVVISAFPVLSARDGREFDRTSAGSTRAVLLLSLLGTAVIGAVALPAAHVLATGPGQVPELVMTCAMFAPGIAGSAVVGNLARVMLAMGRLRVAAAGVGGSWLLVTAADLLLVHLMPARMVAPALALGVTFGRSVAAVALALATRRIRGPAALRGLGHAAVSGLVAGLVSSAIGVAVYLVVPASGKLMAVAVAVAAASLAVITFAAVAYALDRGDLRPVVASLVSMVRSRTAALR